MELKRIIARDSRSANEKAIQLYGPEVLIISTQRLDQQTELIVAVDVGTDSTTDAAEVPADTRSGMTDRRAGPEKAQAPEFTPFAKVFEMANGQAAFDPEPLAADVHLSEANGPGGLSAVVVPPTGEGTWAAEVSAALPVDPLAAPYEQQRSHEIVDLLRQEMAALRKEFALSRQMQAWQPALGQSPEIQKLALAMAEVGMPAALRGLLMDSIQACATLDEAWPVMNRLLVDALKQTAVAVPEKGIHVLCGPTGAGKTSMLGRLAYAAAQSHGAEQQVMISLADQRPGAWSQIQLLAAQAGATCFRAADLSMLQTLLDDLQGKTVWVDTPGIDFAVHAQQLMNRHPGMSLHAVLPVDATVTNVQKILQIKEIRWSSLMLTKMDEAAYPWPLLKSLCDQKMPISCLGENPQISVAPAVFDAQRLVTVAMTPLHSFLSDSGVVDLPLVPAKAARKTRAVKPASIQAAKATPTRTRSRAVKPALSAKAA